MPPPLKKYKFYFYCLLAVSDPKKGKSRLSIRTSSPADTRPGVRTHLTSHVSGSSLDMQPSPPPLTAPPTLNPLIVRYRSRSDLATPPTCYRSLSGPKCPGSVPLGVSGALRAPDSGVSKKCPESVPGVSKCVPDTLGTLFGHSGARGPKGPRDTQRDPRDTSGPKGPRDSCSRSGGLIQI